MITLKPVQNSFSRPTKHSPIWSRFSNTKSSILRLCKSNDSDSQASSPEGDAQKQELLAKIAMLQTQKVRLTDYLDERSAYLTQFAEEANSEFDKIGEDALKGLDEVDARITANIESQMQDFEESAESNRDEIQENENKLEEFRRSN
ncbi:8-amino-7-oxononanoate synthase [Quillaja saponaria]|uniref:8-amino-7-oxononanoate synthase n=1 Tax=Quillaja saponaria TaxID=32244 RepID=A0AAD7PNN5_QUISA|nr:8-amino-7-oxononanoate synthase [Quillaja saponaria]